MTNTTIAIGAALFAVGSLRLWLTWRSRSWVVGERNGTTVSVRRRGRFQELVLARDGEELVQSRQDIDKPLSAGRGYVEGFHLGMLLDPQPEHVVFLGGGACMGPRQFEVAYPEVTIDVVENEPLVIAAANRYFGFRITKRVAVHATDARKFVKDCTFGPYDLVLVDVYDAKGVPAPFLAAEFFLSVRHALKDTGALVMNLVRRPELDPEHVLAAMREAFPTHAMAMFEAGQKGGADNSLVLVAPAIPSTDELLARAAKITVAPYLPEIVRRRVTRPQS